MRSWQEIRWAQPGAERALSAAADSHVALAATWASAVAGTLIPTPAATSSTTAALLPSESRIEMPGLGLTVHAAARQLNIEKRDCDLVLQRRFDRGVCWVAGTETGGTSASARASITRLRGEAEQAMGSTCGNSLRQAKRSCSTHKERQRSESFV